MNVVTRAVTTIVHQLRRHWISANQIVMTAVLMSVPCVAVSAPETDDEPVVIANASIRDDVLTATDVQNVFLGRMTQWSNGEEIVLVTLEDKAVHEAFLSAFIQKSPNQFRMYWKRLAFTGKALTPLQQPDEQTVIKFVSDTKGAVGYVSLGKARAEGCKILAFRPRD